MTDISDKFITLFVWGCFYSVDVFLYLGGFFVAYSICAKGTLKKINLKKPLALVMLFFYRLIRIWPSYIFSLLVYWKLSVYFSNGPAYSGYAYSADLCKDYWY